MEIFSRAEIQKIVEILEIEEPGYFFCSRTCLNAKEVSYVSEINRAYG